MPFILPIYHNSHYITDFKEKAQISYNFFTKQCALADNACKHNADSFKRTNYLLSVILFTKDDIAKTIKNLDRNKANGYDIISICMIIICGELILKPFDLLFNSFMTEVPMI